MDLKYYFFSVLFARKTSHLFLFKKFLFFLIPYFSTKRRNLNEKKKEECVTIQFLILKALFLDSACISGIIGLYWSARTFSKDYTRLVFVLL